MVIRKKEAVRSSQDKEQHNVNEKRKFQDASLEETNSYIGFGEASISTNTSYVRVERYGTKSEFESQN